MEVVVKLQGTGKRAIATEILAQITNQLQKIKTPYWPLEEPRIKREPYDVPQAWMNNILSKGLTSIGFNSEVPPFAGERPSSILPRLKESKKSKKKSKQAIDFEKYFGNRRHVIEVECGNVASIYRSIHKLLLAMEEKDDTVAILIVPSKELMARCEPPSAMSTSHSAPIILSEFAHYHPEANEITVIEFSTNSELNIQDLRDDHKFWKGNFSKAMKKFLDDNFLLFIEHGLSAIELSEAFGHSVVIEYIDENGEFVDDGNIESDAYRCNFIEDFEMCLIPNGGCRWLGEIPDNPVARAISKLW
jgi:hypothetical protein